MQVSELVLAIIGLVLTIGVPWALHRATHPKRQISYYVSQRPYQASPAPSGDSPAPAGPLTVVTLSLWSSGRADVPSENFDQNRPIVFQFSSPIGDPAPDDLGDLGGWRKDGTRRLVLDPTLIGGGTVFTTTVIAADPVGLAIRHPLVDVDLVASRVPPESARTTANVRHLATNGIFWGVAQIAASFLIAVVASFVAPGQPLPSWLSPIVGLLMISGLVTIIIAAVVRLARWATARSKARRGNAPPTSSRVRGDR
jgi:hypothetical protein